MDKAFDLDRALKGKRKGGRLEKWIVLDLNSIKGFGMTSTVILAYIYGDARFEAGSAIKTSPVVAIYERECILETKRTYFDLGAQGDDDDAKSLKTRLGLIW